MQSLPQSDCTASNSRSNDAVIRVYDDGGTVIQTHYHEGEFKSGELLLTSRRSSPKANAHDSAFIGDHEARKLITNALNFSSAPHNEALSAAMCVSRLMSSTVPAFKLQGA
jgi:hypothetical protein